MVTYILGRVPFLGIIIISTDISHQAQALGDHLLGKVRFLLAHIWRVVGEGGHQFQGILANLIAQLLISNDTNAELDKVAERSLEHLRIDLCQLDQSKESGGQLLALAGLLEGGGGCEEGRE